MTLQTMQGRVMIDVSGTTLTPEERARLSHPQTGGVILFSRNFESVDQLSALTTDIHGLRSPTLIMAVDHEGGRVQRFKEGFTRIPAMQALGRIWERDEDGAMTLARQCGFVLAAELRCCGVDMSFTPVLDLDHGTSSVIGDRAFHGDPQIVAALAASLMQGLSDGGMPGCGKHFPGQGHVAADSHLEIPVDDRDLEDIESSDLLPFRRLIAGGLAAVMPAHVIYPRIDARPAGFSSIWLSYLREDLHFDGVIFSDDLSMEGASSAGGYDARARAALDAGCDMVLVCNDPANADVVLAGLAAVPANAVSIARVQGLSRPAPAASLVELASVPRYQVAIAALASAFGE